MSDSQEPKQSRMSKATNLWLLWIGANLTLWMGAFLVDFASKGRPFGPYAWGLVFGLLLLSYEVYRIHNGLKVRSFSLAGVGLLMVIPAVFFGSLFTLLLPQDLSEFTKNIIRWLFGFVALYPIAWHWVSEKQTLGFYNLTPEKVEQMERQST